MLTGVSLTDEGDAAKVLAQAHFAQHGPISTSLMSKYDEAAQLPKARPLSHGICNRGHQRPGVSGMV